MARTGRAVLFATTSPGVCLQYSQVRGRQYRHANRSRYNADLSHKKININHHIKNRID